MSQCDHITFSQKASVDAIDVLSGVGKKLISFDVKFFRVLARTATRQNQALIDVNLVLVLQLSQITALVKFAGTKIFATGNVDLG